MMVMVVPLNNLVSPLQQIFDALAVRLTCYPEFKIVRVIIEFVAVYTSTIYD